MSKAYTVGILMLVFVCLSGCLDSEPETEEKKWILVEEFEITENVTEYFTLEFKGDHKVVYVKLIGEDFFKGQICYGGMCYSIDNENYDGEQEFTIQSDNTECYLNSFNAGIWNVKIYVEVGG